MFDYALAREIVEEIVWTFSPELIIVFGSVARREADEHSDLDLLVVMDTDMEYIKRSVPIRKHLLKYEMAMDIFVLTPEEYLANKDNRFSFASVIEGTGIVVYDASEGVVQGLRGRSTVYTGPGMNLMT